MRLTGIAVNSEINHDTFTKMVSAGAGLGVKDYRVGFAIETEPALSKFFDSGWGSSAQRNGAAKTSNSGESILGSSHDCTWRLGISDYQKGLALQLTLQGTKYYKDDDLNNGRAGQE